MKIDPTVPVLALVMVALNALKPVTIDDTAFLAYAQQIAQHPFDPYGFEVFWYDVPWPAMDLLAPAGLPYWLAIGIALFGTNVLALKLWLLPYALLLVWALHELIDELVPGGQRPLLFLIVLSPTLLPGFNFMLDIPALALALGAMATFRRSLRSERLVLAVAAGLLAGLAMQTKYNVVAPVAAMLIGGLLERRFRHALLAGGVAAGVFVGWETFLLLHYGQSHILHQASLPAHATWIMSSAQWLVGWLSLFGALGLPVALLACLAWARDRRTIAAGIGLASLPFMAIAAIEPPPVPAAIRPVALFSGDAALGIFLLAGCIAVPLVLSTVARSLRRDSAALRSPTTQLLLVWLALELVVSFFVSPFHAARRVMGPILVATLLVAHCTPKEALRGAGMRWTSAYGVALGLLFFVSDLTDARTRQSVLPKLEQELVRLRHDPARQRVWFTGHWGFQFECEQRGYQPLIAGQSVLRRGDFILAAQDISVQALTDVPISRKKGRAVVANPWPFSTSPSFYQGAVPIRRQPRVQLRVRIFRALKDGVMPALPAR